MELNHLDDQAIQNILDGHKTESDEKHLAACPECAAKLNEYQLVYKALGDETEFSLPDSFADSVVTQIAQPETTPEWKWETPVYLVGAFAAIMVILYYFGVLPQSWPEIVNRFASFETLLKFDLLNYFSKPLESVHLNPLMVLMAVLVIAFYGLIDYLYRHRKSKPTTLCA